MNNVSVRMARNSRRGGVAVAVVIALVILQLAVVGMVLAGARDQSMNVHRAESLRSLYAAESGAQMSLRELGAGVDEDGDGEIGSISADGLPGTGPILEGSRASAELVYTIPETGEIISRASATQSSRTVRVAYSIPAATSAGGAGAGLAADFFALASAPSNLASVNWGATPSANGPAAFVNFVNASDSTYRFWNTGPTTRYGVRLTGKIDIPQDGTWTFTLGSDDGSRLLIDGVQVINYDGLHGYGTRTGNASLTAGEHDIQILFFENGGNHALTLAWRGPGVSTTTIVPPSALSMLSELAPAFPPIALADTMYIWGDNSATAAYIDGFDASAGAYGGSNVLTDRLLVSTNATGSQRIQMSQLAQVKGMVNVGPGGNPASVIAMWSGSAITGGATARSIPVGVHRYVDPYVSMPASSGSVTYTSSQTLSTNRTFQNLSVWGNSTVITISGNIVVRCTGNLQFGDQVKFELAAGASLALFVAGDVNIYNQAQVNFNTGDPARCWIFMTGANRRLQLTDRVKLVAHVRNPGGSLEMYGTYTPGSELYGTYHGRTFTMTDKARFHADVSLMTSGGAGGEDDGAAASPVVTAWSQEP